MPVDLNWTIKFTDNVYFTPKLDDTVQVTDPVRNILSDYIVVQLANGGYVLKAVSDCKMYEKKTVSDCKVDEKEILEILQEN